jgi:two-component system LytT family sensor kinase
MGLMVQILSIPVAISQILSIIPVNQRALPFPGDNMQDGNRDEPVFMNPLIFISASVLVGLLFAFQEWYSVHKMGYHIQALIFFESWGFQFLVWGSICWMFWRFLKTCIQRASLLTTLTLFLPLSIVTSLGQQMLYVLVFHDLPPDHPEASYWKRLSIYVDAELLNNVLIFWCAFFLFRGIGYYQRSREHERAKAELETQLANSQLAALRMQLNPHFLFNAMNSISSLMRSDVNAADTMLEQLSSLLRISLERGYVQLIPLRDEMDFIEVYLSMQDQRYAGRVKREVAIDSELHDALVPAMFLQPLVENAYAHGLSKIEKGGDLIINAHRENGMVAVSVTNSGLGLNHAGGKNGHGIGLANIRGRLRLHYGEKCSFDMSEIDRTHVKVTITFPFQLAKEAENGIARYGGE